MALNIPKAIAGIIVNNDPAQRMLNGIVNSVNPVINFLNNTFQAVSDGSVSVIPNVSFRGNQTVNGNQTVTGSQTVNGSATFNNALTTIGANILRGSVVIQKLLDGTQGSLLVQGNLTVNGATSSSTGFKTVVDVGTTYASAAAANTYYRTRRYNVSEGTGATYNAPQLIQFPYSGSLVGISSFSQGSVGGTGQLGIWTNQTVVPGIPSGTPQIIYNGLSASNGFGTVVAFPKGQYPINANDYWQMAVAFNTAGNQFMDIRLMFEFNA